MVWGMALKNLISETFSTDFKVQLQIKRCTIQGIQQLFCDILRNKVITVLHYSLENNFWPVGNDLLGRAYRRQVSMPSFLNRLIHISSHEKNQYKYKLKIVSKSQPHSSHSSGVRSLANRDGLGSCTIHSFVPWALECFPASRGQYSRNESDPKFTMFSRMPSLILNCLPGSFPWLLLSPLPFCTVWMEMQSCFLCLLALCWLSLGLFLSLDNILL